MYECDDVRIGDCCHSKQTWQTITRNRFDYGDFILQIWCTVGSKWHLIAILLLAFCAYDCGISTRCLVCPGIWFGMAYLQTAHRIHRYHLPLVSLNESSTAPRKMLSLSFRFSFEWLNYFWFCLWRPEPEFEQGWPINSIWRQGRPYLAKAIPLGHVLTTSSMSIHCSGISACTWIANPPSSHRCHTHCQ